MRRVYSKGISAAGLRQLPRVEKQAMGDSRCASRVEDTAALQEVARFGPPIVLAQQGERGIQRGVRSGEVALQTLRPGDLRQQLGAIRRLRTRMRLCQQLAKAGLASCRLSIVPEGIELGQLRL